MLVIRVYAASELLRFCSDNLTCCTTVINLLGSGEHDKHGFKFLLDVVHMLRIKQYTDKILTRFLASFVSAGGQIYLSHTLDKIGHLARTDAASLLLV